MPNFHLVSAAGTNATSILGTAGSVRSWKIFNNAGYPIFVKFHDVAGVPTPGQGVIYTIGVQAGLSVDEAFAYLAFQNGIGLSITKGIGDSDTTPIAAADCVLDIGYLGPPPAPPSTQPFAPVGLPIDLTWLSQVKAFAEVSSSKDDRLISDQITAFSKWVLTYCSRDTLNSIETFTEVYDGNGSNRLFLRNSPIQSIVSVQVGAVTLPLSSGFASGGVFIEQSGRSIGIRCPAASGSSRSTYYPPGGNQYFSKGLGNVQVVYTAGYPPQTQTQELETIAQQTIPLEFSTFASDLGEMVYYPSLVPLIPVGSSPAPGQYAVSSNGLYVFNSADNGNQVLVNYSYNAPPPDLEFACRRTVGIWYKRRAWIDQSSKELHAEGAGGTTRYQSWPLRPEDRITINSYKRYALV